MIILDTISITDLEKLRCWRNQPEIRRWCRQTGLIEEAQQKKWFERISTDPSIRMYSIVAHEIPFPANLDLIGVCGLTDITPVHNTAEFSIYIAENQRRGYATEALKQLLEIGFNELNLNRIWGETFEGNPGMKLYEKLGFQKEGKLRQTYWKDGAYQDSYIYSMLRGDFMTAQ